VRALLKGGANANAQESNGGHTALMYALSERQDAVVEELATHGADVELASTTGFTPLMFAAQQGDADSVRILIKAGAKVNVVENVDHQTPLMWAAASGKNAAEMVKLLLAKGADVKVRANYSDWPSQITSEPRAQYRPVGGLTALLYGARSGCYDCVRELIEAGADVNVPTPEAVSPVMIALDNDHNDVAKLLLDKGANPGVWDWWGRTALYIAIDRKETNAAPAGGGRGGRGGRTAAAKGVSNMDIINALLAADVDPNPELNMHRPSRGGNSGRFIENQLSTGCTPLFRATQGNDLEVIQALLARGANPNINTMGLTAFLVAAGVGPGSRGGTGLAAAGAVGGSANVAVMDALVQHGADVNAQVTGTETYSMRVSRAPSSNEGMTALHVAAQGGRVDLVRYLIEKGARTDIVDSNGHKPVDLLPALGGRGGAAPATPPVTANLGATAPPQAAATPPPAAPAGGRAVSPTVVAEIRTLLENAASKK
jgi:uncharacterized protein